MKKYLLFLFFISLNVCMSQERVVIIDPAHGGIDMGDVSRDKKYSEKYYTLELAKLTSEKVRTDVKVILSRENDTLLKKKDISKLIHDNNAELTVVIHIGTSEFEDEGCVIYSNKFLHQKFLEFVSKELKKHLRCNNFAVKDSENLLMFRDSKGPILIIKVEDMYSTESINYLNNLDGLDEISSSIATIINHYFIN